MSGNASAPSTSKIKVGSRSIVCNDAELRGDITIGSGCIIHPRCTVFAHAGPIVIGDNCVVEETAIILNRSKQPMIIGSNNLFEVGCRVESLKIGSHNTFEPKCRVSSAVTLDDFCVIGAGCTLVPDAQASEADFANHFDSSSLDSETRDAAAGDGDVVSQGAVQGLPPIAESGEPAFPAEEEQHAQPVFTETTTDAQGESVPQSKQAFEQELAPVDHLASYTVIYSSNNARRTWSGEGKEQQRALFVKHVAYLTEILPKFNKLKLIT